MVVLKFVLVTALRTVLLWEVPCGQETGRELDPEETSYHTVFIMGLEIKWRG